MIEMIQMMLAKDLNKTKCRYPVLVQEKFDGVPCLITGGGESTCMAYSRQLKPILSVGHIQEQLSAGGIAKNTTIIGELVAPRQTVQGYLRARQRLSGG